MSYLVKGDKILYDADSFHFNLSIGTEMWLPTIRTTYHVVYRGMVEESDGKKYFFVVKGRA